MYHIKNDKRAQLSAQLIVDGLLDCMATKPFSKITISDLQKQTGVSRGTFYRLFDITQDILEYQCDRILIGFSEKIKAERISPDNIVRAFTRHIVNHMKFFEALKMNHCLDVFYKSHMKNTDYIKDSIPMVRDARYADYYSSMLAAAIVNIVMVWIERGCREDASQLDYIRQNILNPKLFA